MSRWDRNKNDVQDTLNLKKIHNDTPLQDNAIQMNEIDKDVFHDLVDRYDAMADNLDSGLKEYAPFDHLSEDIYNGLYKHNVRMNDADDMKTFSRFNHEMMDEMTQSDEFEQLRRSTKGDMMSSAIATEVLQQKAMEKIDFYKQQYALQKQSGQAQDGGAAGELIDQINNGRHTQDQIDELMDAVGGDSTALSKKQAQKLAQLQQQLNDIQDEIDANFDGQRELQQGLADTSKKGSKAAMETVHEIRDIVNAWGLEAGENNRRISVDERKKAIERVRRSKRLKDLTDIIGRMKNLAMQKKKIKKKDGHSIADVELGNRIENLIPSELMRLASPATKRDFVHRFHQKQLLQYYKVDQKTVGRGPIVVCHDKSGSMSGESDDWSTALCLAMLEVAQKEKRNYAYIPYQAHVIGNMVKNIKAGELDPNDIMDIAELSVGGGTNFMAPIDEAIRSIESDSYKKADIVFITDGDCGVTDEWLANIRRLKEEKQFFINTVLIDTYRSASIGTIGKFSDHITRISSLAELDDSTAAEIFRMTEDKDKFATQGAGPAPSVSDPAQP